MTTNAMQKVNDITGGNLTLGQAIKAIRLSDGIQQNSLAAKLNGSPAYLSEYWLSGIRSTSCFRSNG